MNERPEPEPLKFRRPEFDYTYGVTRDWVLIVGGIIAVAALLVIGFLAAFGGAA